MRRELIRQGIHLTYGVLFTLLCAYNIWIGVAFSVTLILVSLAQRAQDLPLIGALITRLERPDDPLPLFGPITITIGITSVILVFPEYGVIAGLGIAIIDSLATAIGMLGQGKRKKLAASFAGGFVFFIVVTSAFSEVSLLKLALSALAGIMAEFFTSKHMLIDDNITVPWAIVITLALIP